VRQTDSTPQAIMPSFVALMEILFLHCELFFVQPFTVVSINFVEVSIK